MAITHVVAAMRTVAQVSQQQFTHKRIVIFHVIHILQLLFFFIGKIGKRTEYFIKNSFNGLFIYTSFAVKIRTTRSSI